MAVAAIAAEVAGGRQSLVLKGHGQGLEAQDQILNDRAVLLGQTGKHGSEPSGWPDHKVFFRLSLGRNAQPAEARREALSRRPGSTSPPPVR